MNTFEHIPFMIIHIYEYLCTFIPTYAWKILYVCKSCMQKMESQSDIIRISVKFIWLSNKYSFFTYIYYVRIFGFNNKVCNKSPQRHVNTIMIFNNAKNDSHNLVINNTWNNNCEFFLPVDQTETTSRIMKIATRSKQRFISKEKTRERYTQIFNTGI